MVDKSPGTSHGDFGYGWGQPHLGAGRQFPDRLKLDEHIQAVKFLVRTE
ncbi:MAG: hypothetical protein ACHQXK_02690 [Methanosarcina thermophila]|nr:hypothetical protein [Methanosarcina thermophila]HOA68644.1 hypothetical protein [Methanosarcina thermophila]HOQ65244.1 hypothetical protein [Methanosarcina thermophila]HPT80755.1 hypothetical protein [Methanosarcina thermophila]HPZ19994.1 hypothetical protein [Methanosarcina thermophila]HQD94400.1 hypothetical protein [Methanosarcina thermophila]